MTVTPGRAGVGIKCGSIVAVARAGDLREGGFVDGGADVGFKLGDVLRDALVLKAAPELVLHLLYVVGGHVEWRHADIGDAKHDPLAVRGAGGLSIALLGRA